MRLRPAILSLLLALFAAPAASAHGDGEVTHRDTPAELAGANISRAIASASLASGVSGDAPQYLPTTWCGARTTTDDVADAAFPASSPQIKVVYAYAAGDSDRFASWDDSLQADVSRIEQYLTLQSGGRRAVRFDMGTQCGPQYVDLQVVQLPQPRSAYIDDFYQVAGDVRARLGLGAGTRDVFVLADDLTDSGVYGTAQVVSDSSPGASNVTNGGGLTAIMWTDSGSTPDATGWQPTVMLHEITHNLGAVQSTAPHMTSYAHCTDGEDVMCYPDGSFEAAGYDPNVCPLGSGAIPQTYDCGHNDYYDPDGVSAYLTSHWNVYRSAFMAPCTQLGSACGGDFIPAPPVNSAPPHVTGTPKTATVLGADVGSWLNSPTAYAIQWQRSTVAGWQDIPGATGTTYFVATADAGSALRVMVTASNDDGAAVVASAPTAAVVNPYAVVPRPPVKTVRLRITLRGHGRSAGVLSARVAPLGSGREVRTSSARVALGAGKWRLRLCAGPRHGALRCLMSSSARARGRTVRLPSVRVVVRSAGALRVTAAAIDRRAHVRASGSAAAA